MLKFAPKLYLLLLKEYIVTAYHRQVVNSQEVITRAFIKNYVVETIKNNPDESKELLKIFEDNKWDYEDADTFRTWENFLRGNKGVATKDHIIKAICIAFQVPGWKDLDILQNTENGSNTDKSLESNYYLGFFYSEQYRLKKFLLEIFNNNTVNLYYIEQEGENADQVVIKDRKSEYYCGEITVDRILSLSRGNQYSQIILSSSHSSLSYNITESEKLHILSGLWIKEHYGKYETVNSILLQKIQDKEIQTIKNAQIELDEIFKISNWRRDKQPYQLKNREYELKLKNPALLADLPGKYQIYECLTNGKEFSRFILNISENLELSLYRPSDNKLEVYGYLKLRSTIRAGSKTIILNFPLKTEDRCEIDFIKMILQVPQDYSEISANKNSKPILTGGICETIDGKPFCGCIYAKKILDKSKSAPDESKPDRFKLESMIDIIQNNNEYPNFFPFFLGESDFHHCIISRKAYNELYEKVHNVHVHSEVDTEDTNKKITTRQTNNL